MGNAGGILKPEENGRIYRVLDCGCICSLKYREYCTESIELLCPCYYCLENLKARTYDNRKISKLFENSVNKNIFDLVTIGSGSGSDSASINYDNWLVETDAIAYAKRKKIPYEELVPNDELEHICPNYSKRDLLKKFNVIIY